MNSTKFRAGISCDILSFSLNGSGFKSRYKQKIFFPPKRPDWLWGPPSLLFNRYGGYFPGIKRPEHELDNPPPYSNEVKERLQLNFYTPPPRHAFMACYRVACTITLTCLVSTEYLMKMAMNVTGDHTPNMMRRDGYTSITILVCLNPLKVK